MLVFFPDAAFCSCFIADSADAIPQPSAKAQEIDEATSRPANVNVGKLFLSPRLVGIIMLGILMRKIDDLRVVAVLPFGGRLLGGTFGGVLFVTGRGQRPIGVCA